MNQIFDWLREQINKNIYSIPLQNNHGVKFKAIDIADAENIINEAEAKWESECCEWKHHNKYEYAESGCGISLDTHRIGIAKFSACPYCGKPIKIAEVE